MQSKVPPLAVVALLFVLFLGANPQILVDWSIYSFDDGTYSHAYLIPFMSAYISYEGWRQGHLNFRWSWAYFACFIVALLLFQWMDFAHQRLVSRALIPVNLILLTLTCFPANRYTLTTGALFWFITPIWGPISALLQASSVAGVSWIMSFTGIPTFIYDEFVQIPAGTFEIANGCSGLRYVIAASALVTFYGAMYLTKIRSMAILAACAIIGSILTNWLRITILILIGEYTDMQAPIIQDHNMFGWFLFVPLMFLIFFFADRLERNTDVSPSGDSMRGVSIATSPMQILVLLASIITASGLTLRAVSHSPLGAIFSEVDVETAEAVTLSESPGPTLFAVSDYSVSVTHIGESRVVSYEFTFDGFTDASRAEFYLNEVVPAGWAIIEDTIGEETRSLKLSNGANTATVLISYELDGRRTGDIGKLKRSRLRSALKLDRSSKLHWSFTECRSDCPEEKVEQ